jgi:hypothetical protein
MAGLAIGAVDYHINQSMLITALLIIPNAFLGFLRPKIAWLNALSCFAGFLFINIIFGYIFNYPPARWPYFTIWIALITPIPAFIGSYWGAAVRWLVERSRHSRQ